jgi:hypothetical protein
VRCAASCDCRILFFCSAAPVPSGPVHCRPGMLNPLDPPTDCSNAARDDTRAQRTRFFKSNTWSAALWLPPLSRGLYSQWHLPAMGTASLLLLLLLASSCSATADVSTASLTLGPPVGSHTSASTVGINLGAHATFP